MTVHDHGNGDEDSLFGSPPSSPTRGRSPPLALPSGHGSQNVGTIALPGSHIYSEYPVSQLASSWCAAPELPPRPPAQPSLANGPAHPNQQPEKTSRNSSRASSKKNKGKQKKSTSRPSAPPIALPDPNAPPPANFLRNQQALLGLAGLVGRVNPATLSTQRSILGSTCVNPIVVDDDRNDHPRLGPNAYSTSPNRLTPPSQQHIVESLIKQKNIFPVLESLLKLLGSGGSQPPTSPLNTPECRKRSEEPLPKKRKLSSVPAGAADWDVPYPFSEGEGPREYRANWERDRCRQLITQLVDSLKSAARTAARKTYVQQQKEAKERLVIPAISKPLGLPQQTMAISDCEGLQTTTHVPTSPKPINNTNAATRSGQCDVAPNLASAPQLHSDFDQFFMPLLQTQNILTNENADIDTIPEMDPSFYEAWKSLVESFTTGDMQQIASIAAPSTSTSSEATNLSFPDFAIDPVLLAMSAPPVSVHPSAGSSMQTTSSIADPLTPNWDLSLPEPEIFNIDPVESSMGANECLQPSGANQESLSLSSTLQPPLSTQNDALTPSSSSPANTVAMEHTLARADESRQLPGVSIQPTMISTPLTPHHTQSLQGLSESTLPMTMNPITQVHSAIPAMSSTHSTPVSGGPTTGKASREDILRRARERRRQMITEVERAKVELWETTIEQGVLAHITKEKL